MLKKTVTKKSKDILSAGFTLGNVDLNVKDLDIMKKFYHDVLDLDIIKDNSESVILGKNSKVLLTLHHAKQMSQSEKNDAGLYHFAFLFSSRGDLARTVYRIIKTVPQSFAGSSDHLVSEAFYFNDAEGNGIELYFDRDKSTWQWENNQVKMGSMYIDPVDYLERYIVLEEKNTETTLGHIHLKVGDIEKARTFYVDILGFEITAQMPHALFISVGGYHHHIGMNTWESFGASERKNTLGLKNYEMNIVEKNDFKFILEQLKKNNIFYKEEKNAIIFNDPWNNQITVRLHEV
jgi:catechol 2,3-dioxygenase